MTSPLHVYALLIHFFWNLQHVHEDISLHWKLLTGSSIANYDINQLVVFESVSGCALRGKRLSHGSSVIALVGVL